MNMCEIYTEYPDAYIENPLNNAIWDIVLAIQDGNNNLEYLVKKAVNMTCTYPVPINKVIQVLWTHVKPMQLILDYPWDGQALQKAKKIFLYEVKRYQPRNRKPVLNQQPLAYC